MSLLTQSCFPGIPTRSPIDAALESVRGLTLPHSNYERFVREVGAKALGHRRGAVIMCAAPSDISCDEIIASVTAEIEARHIAREGKEYAGVRVIDTPSGLRRGPGVASIIDAYHHSIERPNTTHRFRLQAGEAFIPREPFYQVSGLIRHASPAACFVRNVHALQTSRRGIDDAVDAVAALVEMAGRSNCTHILIGHTSVVLEWLKRAEIARDVSASVLSPYNLANDLDHANFVNVLRAYDSILPWRGDSLEAHLDEIDQVVAGSPHRLRKWLEEALCNANAERENHLHWERMVAKQPLKAERVEAWKERNSVCEFLEEGDDLTKDDSKPDDAKATGERRAKGPPPGIRKPNRNPRIAA